MEYFVHLQPEHEESFENYLSGRNIEYKVFELKDKCIFHLALEKDVLKEMSKLEYIAQIEAVNPVNMLNSESS